MRRKTHEEFINEFKAKNEYSDKIEFLSEYITNNTHIQCKCKVCGYEWISKPVNVLKGKGCPKCNNCVKVDEEEYFKRIYSKLEFADINISDFSELKNNVNCHCKKCEYTWTNKAVNLLHTNGCPKCGTNSQMRYTHEKYVEDINDVYNGEYTVIGKFKTIEDKIELRHICGREFEVNAFTILHKKTSCPSCRLHKKWTPEEFKNKIQEINDSVILLDDYVDSSTSIRYKCKICEKVHTTMPSRLLSGFKCVYCNENIKYTTETYKEKLKEKNIDIFPLEEYVTAHHKIKHKCEKCGWEWSAKPNNILSGFGCPHCRSSKGEIKIEDFLKYNHLKYEKEYSFDNLRSEEGYKLRFDFALLEEDNTVWCLCEFDGIQHFELTNFSYRKDDDSYKRAELKYERLKKSDELKNIYCQVHNIPLIRIPYYDFDNIEDILAKELNLKVKEVS